MTDDVALFWMAALSFGIAYFATRAACGLLDESALPFAALSAMLWGVPMHHYVIDGVIWRSRS